MDQITLQKLVETISMRVFSKPFEHQAIFNPRLKTTGGRYFLKTHHLDFNPLVLEVLGMETFEGVIRHELCHYHLHLEGKGHRHKDQDFKQLLKEVDGLRYTPALKERKQVNELWKYHCKNCLQIYYRKRRINTTRYVCSKCRGTLVLDGKENIAIE
ncbi:SprT family protein [Marinilactibacillus kalidii]|uniref:SprT family protein n=1 Tax=Marinilactibacillus kalidii TaxID=2820274 RepID=UPI001ABE6713|nr:SprT family protein [Marinilactibacillus kalidii]